jgi:hypothetical protein
VITGRVAHSRISDVDQDIVRDRTGFGFVDLAPGAVAAIEAFLTQVQDTRSGV